MKLNIHFLLIQTYVHSNHAIKRANTDKPLVWGDVPMRDSEKKITQRNFITFICTSLGGGKVPFYKYIQIAAIKG